MSKKISPRRACLLVLVLLILAALAWHLEAVSRLDQEALMLRPGPLVLDREGRILRLVPEFQGRKLVILPEGEVPPVVSAAFVAAEDQRFWHHPGIDPLAILRAAATNLTHGRVISGASTIPQQLARLIYPGPRSYYRKLVEMARSLRLSIRYSKEEILRQYLNRVPLGSNLMGVEAGAWAYFGKTASNLTYGEAATLAALVKAPSALNPYGPNRDRLLVRQRWVLSRMAQLGYLSSQEFQACQAEPPRFRGHGPRPPAFPFEAPHFVNLVLAREKSASGPQRLWTTLDLPLQRRAQAIVSSHQARLKKAGASQAAAVIVDNTSREVLALVGSCAYSPRDQGYNNGAAAWRSPGSTLKPFLYGLALDQGFTSASVLEDVERRYRTPRGEFIPSNFDRVSHGPVSFREALGNSLNLSAVHLLNLVGPETYYDTLANLNLINRPEFSPDHYGLGLVVGNPEVSLLQLAAAYASLGHRGSFAPLRLTLDAPRQAGTPIFSPQAAFIISDILSDPMARARIFGGAVAMNPPYRLAIKTGTSTRYRDEWAVGYTPEYTLAVWVGNFDGRPTVGLSGATAAAPIVADLAAVLFAGAPPAPFKKPAGVIAAEVCAFSGLNPGPGCVHQRREFFITGTEPQTVCTYHHRKEPWHRIPANFAGWLHQRFDKGGEGRFRLADFDQDLRKTFASPVAAGPKANASRRHPEGAVIAGLPSTNFVANLASARSDGLALQVSISSPLNGDRYLLPPHSEVIRLTGKARCRDPLKKVNWFVDGLEVAATGPPYELLLELGRGRHRITVVGPGNQGDSVEVFVQ
ncbi:MAG: penicillin-binding protein 1C [Thermodesulfobacteriota bacterium]